MPIVCQDFALLSTVCRCHMIDISFTGKHLATLKRRGCRLTIFRIARAANASSLLVINIIIKAICNAQDPLKKAANALSGS